MATSKLIQWLPEILQATDEDIARFGPQAARVRALLDFIPGMSGGAIYVAGNAATYHAGDFTRSAAWGAAQDAAHEAADNAARSSSRWDAVNAAMDTARGTARDAAWDAAGAEIINDLIDPQTYRILTDPLNAGRVYDLRLPDAGSEFMNLVHELGPRSTDDIERIADLSVDPQMQGILELLGGLQGGMPLAAKIDAARRLDRASRAGRRLS